VTASDFIVDVSESNFDFEVLAYSQQTPVLVDFWAEWCVPCRTLEPILERLAQEANGGFRLARLNVDQNPNLAIRYNVRGIPAVKAFRDGRIVSEFTGALPESRVREFVRPLVPSAADLLLEKAESMVRMGQWKSAEQNYRKVTAEQPSNPTALLGLAKSLLMTGQIEDSLSILQRFPPSHEYSNAQMVRPLAEDLIRVQRSPALSGDDPLDAAYDRSLRLVLRGNLEAAMDGLLDILRQDKRYRSGAARKALLALFELLGDENLITRQYRSELASVLF
jgi:putative thioredoxin